MQVSQCALISDLDQVSICITLPFRMSTRSVCVLWPTRSHLGFTHLVCVLRSHPGFTHLICVLHSHPGLIPIQFAHCTHLGFAYLVCAFEASINFFKIFQKILVRKNLKYPYIPYRPSLKGMVYSLNFYILNSRIKVEH